MAESETSYVYVIGPAEGAQKVGYGANPERRRDDLQVGSAALLMIHHKERVRAKEAGLVERLAHYALRAWHERGEWFQVTPEDATKAVREAAQSAMLGADEPVISKRAKSAPITDGLRRLYQRGFIDFSAFEAGLAYRQVRRIAAKGSWVTMANGIRGDIGTVADATRRLRQLDGEIIRQADVEALRAVIAVAYRAENVKPSDLGPLRKGLSIVDRLLEQHLAA